MMMRDKGNRNNNDRAYSDETEVDGEMESEGKKPRKKDKRTQDKKTMLGDIAMLFYSTKSDPVENKMKGKKK